MSNKSNTQAATVTEEVTETPAVAPLTPYGAAKLVNQALENAGLTKRIPPQMMYNYTKGRINAGKVPFITYDENKGVDRDSLNTWIEAYLVKQVAKVTAPADVDEVDEVVEAN